MKDRSMIRRFLDGVRSIFFNLAFFGLTGLFLFCCIPGLFMSLRVRRRISLIWFWGVYQCEKYIMNLDYRVIGQDNMPSGPCIIAAKHQSAWETLKVYRIFGDTTAIVAKKELMDIPIWGQYGRAMGLVPIDRSKGKEAMQLMVDKANEAIENGRSLLLFPQGTRIRVSAKAPYKGGIIKLYDGLNVPVVPVALNAGVFWPKNSFWKKSGTITVEILPAIPAGLPTDQMFDRLVEAIETASDRLCNDVTV